MSREEMAGIDASVGVFGSDDVRKAVTEFGDIVFEFRPEAGHYERFLEGGFTADGRENQFARLQELRKRARAKLLEIERAMQRQLAE